MSDIKNRSELLFCYDIKDANPNGDPLDSNKPRIDEETGINIVTDVRLKRTIRDYLFQYKGFTGENGKDIFVRETILDEAKQTIKDGKSRAKDFGKNKDEMLESILGSCIDIRAFGGVLPLANDSITFTGPIQFRMGRSMHGVEMKYIKGTGAFASDVGKKHATFREEYILPYSFISFYGIINEHAARDTRLSEDDINLILEGMWDGTKNLISRSKFGQLPRLLLRVQYTKPGFFIGDLDKMISLKSDKRDEELRDPADFVIDITMLNKILTEHTGVIDKVGYLIDPRVKLELGGSDVTINGLLPGKMSPISFS